MHLGRPTTPEDRFSIKAAVRRLLKMAGGQEAASFFTRGKHQTLNRYGNVNEPDCQIPLDVALDLEIETGSMDLTALMAERHGCMLIKKSTVAADANILTHISALACETGEAVKAAVEAYADGTETIEELDNIIQQSTDAEHAAAAMRIAAQTKREALLSNVTKIRGNAA